jgi:glycerophosphoryl diester phosphodiesterase
MPLRPALAGLALAVSAGLVTAPAQAAPAAPAPRVEQLDEPLVFGHRGASGYRPEHTLASYKLAIQMGADYIEPDLVSTKDGVLVARHENEIGTTTDVADHPEFADRKTTKTIDGIELTGWFTEDFTLAELRTLRAVERLPDVRKANTKYDGRFKVPTFDQVLQLAKKRGVGVAPETKHPSYFDSIDLSLEEPVLKDLRQAGLAKKRSRVVIQSFETANLRELDKRTQLPLVQLVDATGGPADQPKQTYAAMVRPAGLRKVARYADWLGPNKDLVLPRDPKTGAVDRPSRVVPAAHRAGLRVVVFTVRAENQFMATDFQRGSNPNRFGDMAAEVTALLDAGVDGIFSDHADLAVEARDAWVS